MYNPTDFENVSAHTFETLELLKRFTWKRLKRFEVMKRFHAKR